MCPLTKPLAVKKVVTESHPPGNRAKIFLPSVTNSCSIDSMRLNFVAPTSRFFNDKAFYRIRSSPLIISLQF